jgi:4-amino-4-deoxy-L-arabinose transferase-like glycosyltransferase
VELRRIGDPGLARALKPAAALAALTLLRLAVAARAPLAPDEAYYWIWSHALAPGYLDHPPMVALWIRCGTILAGDTPLGIRLPGPLSAVLGTWLLADAAERLLPGRRAGLAAGSLFNATLLLGAGSVIMTPDTPLLFFWTATIWALARLSSSCEALIPSSAPGAGRPYGNGCWFLAAGACAGLALTSKFTAIFLLPGIGIWLLWVPALRPWLRRPLPWLAVLLGIALFLPVVLWNSQHGWVGLLRQGGRVADWEPRRAVGFLGELLGSQIGLATPLVFLLCTGGLAVAWRRAWRDRDPAFSLLTALSLPPVLIFVQHAMGDRVQGNWPAIIYPAACIAAAGLTIPGWRRLHVPAVALGLAITGVVYVQAVAEVIPLPLRLNPIARQLAGWNVLAAEADAVRRQSGASYIAADQYALASELARALPPGVEAVGVGPRWTLTTLEPAKLSGQTGLLLRPVRDGAPAPGDWHGLTPLGEIIRNPGNAGSERYLVFRVEGGPAREPVTTLPRPSGRNEVQPNRATRQSVTLVDGMQD